jgi:hypothetical protein
MCNTTKDNKFGMFDGSQQRICILKNFKKPFLIRHEMQNFTPNQEDEKEMERVQKETRKNAS